MRAELGKAGGKDLNNHYSQKNHCNDNCNDFSDYNGIIAPLDKLLLRGAIMLHLSCVLVVGTAQKVETSPCLSRVNQNVTSQKFSLTFKIFRV